MNTTATILNYPYVGREGSVYIAEPTLVVPHLEPKRNSSHSRRLGLALLAIALGGIFGPLSTSLRLEGYLLGRKLTAAASRAVKPQKPLPPAVPVVFNPLVTPEGAAIEPVNREFSLIVPKIGINAPVIAAVNPANPGVYLEALQKGVAHAATSFFPDEAGTVYLFSHSTNYEWFVRDLNAVFYLLKNLEAGDLVVIFYKGNRYTYRLTEKRIVGPKEVGYLVPQAAERRLILQTCWPPGSVAQRLLLFAELIEETAQAV